MEKLLREFPLYTIHYSDQWLVANHKKAELIKQGWKIHISCTPKNYEYLMQSIVETLNTYNTSFKIPKDYKSFINILNDRSIIQSGKVITVYCSESEIFNQLIEELHLATQEIHGCDVYTDKNYKDSSCIFYRYGSFTGETHYDELTNKKQVTLFDNKDTRQSDLKGFKKYKPEWIEDPLNFININNQSVINNYRPLKVLSTSGKGLVLLVEQNNRRFIMKIARKHTMYDYNLRDSSDRLTNEYQNLKHLEDYNVTPKAYSLSEDKFHSYLLMEFIEGQSLREYIGMITSFNQETFKVLNKITLNIITLFKKLLSINFKINDFSPNNIIVNTKNLSVKFIDLEYSSLSQRELRGFTPGYVLNSEVASDHDDIYALGAIISFIFTGLEPLRLNNNINYLFNYNWETFNNSMYYEVSSIARDLMDNPASFNSVDSIDTLIEKFQLLNRQTDKYPPSISPSSFDLQKEISQTLGNIDNVVRNIHKSMDFKNKNDLLKKNDSFHSLNFHNGLIGIMKFCLEAYNFDNNNEHILFVKKILKWIDYNISLENTEIPPSLHFGHGYLPIIQKKVYEITKEEKLKNSCISNALQISSNDNINFDITHGMAGIGMMLLEVHSLEPKNKEILFRLRKIVNNLLANVKYEKQHIYWESYSYQGNKLMVSKSLGYAHGISGIGDFLLKYLDIEYRYEVKKILDEILFTLKTQKKLEDGKVYWSHKLNEMDTIPWTHWCNGSGGITDFLINYYERYKDNEVKILIEKSLDYIISDNSYTSINICHGLSGRGLLFVKAAEVLNNSNYFDEACKSFKRLKSLTIIDKGVEYWLSEDNNSIDPEYMTGYIGVYAFSLKLNNLYTFYEEL